MTTEIRVPTLGESVTEATIAQWFKKAGEAVAIDEPLVELETDKVTIEVPAPAAGVLSEILVQDGETVEVGALLGAIGEGTGVVAAPAPATAPETPPVSAASADNSSVLSPAVNKLVAENNIDPVSVAGSGKDGRLTKGDILAALDGTTPSAAPAPQAKAPVGAEDGVREERVRMTRLRQTIARRLKDAQNTAAMLTTFNEVDMTEIMSLRNTYKAEFEKKHGVRMGFMSFFTKACCHALKEIPEVNAEIDGTDVIYKNYVHMGVAAGTPTGLVVPVIRDVDQMSFAEIEKAISEKGKRARDGKLTMADMQGGTFTISNGGVYGSLMTAPILNPPQSGILGMAKIMDRPMAINGEVVIRPMMYLSLSYDHRIVDGKGAVTFLVRVKDALEDPRRLLMDL